MVTLQGFALIAELIAAAVLIATLFGFWRRRSKPWFVASVVAFVALIVVVTVIIDSTA